MKRLFSTIAAFPIACNAHAQQNPDHIVHVVNDSADIIDAKTERRVEAKLAEIAKGHDTEVVTPPLSSLRFYAEDSTIGAYSKGLFNRWAIGNAERNDGLMVLVFRADREVRVQAGAGYDASAQDQIAHVFADR
ncbi:MAG: TPM domain-containing protein [Octadecabacter sp.]|nr:TPM domain-containing protein [Octadecabacter sp.]